MDRPSVLSFNTSTTDLTFERAASEVSIISFWLWRICSLASRRRASAISDASFNPWERCWKVSPALATRRADRSETSATFSALMTRLSVVAFSLTAASSAASRTSLDRLRTVSPNIFRRAVATPDTSVMSSSCRRNESASSLVRSPVRLTAPSPSCRASTRRPTPETPRSEAWSSSWAVSCRDRERPPTRRLALSAASNSSRLRSARAPSISPMTRRPWATVSVICSVRSLTASPAWPRRATTAPEASVSSADRLLKALPAVSTSFSTLPATTEISWEVRLRTSLMAVVRTVTRSAASFRSSAWRWIPSMLPLTWVAAASDEATITCD